MFRHNATADHAPLRLPRLISLLFLFAFGVIAMGVGINALVKFNDEKRDLRKQAPQGSTVDVNANDVLDTGYNITVVCGVLALLSVIFLVPTLFGARFLRIQSFVLGFFTLWLFATLIPFDVFFANRSAQVSASIAGFPIQPSVIQTIINSLGQTTRYKDVGYLRLVAIIPWFTFLFGVTSTVLAFMASRRSRATTGYPATSAGDRGIVNEKVPQQA